MPRADREERRAESGERKAEKETRLRTTDYGPLKEKLKAESGNGNKTTDYEFPLSHSPLISYA